MPELPEVETIRRGLLEYIPGLKISEVKVFCDKSFPGATKMILGATVKDLRRFGKALVIDLDNEVSIICHLRMTGQMILWGFLSERKPQRKKPSMVSKSRTCRDFETEYKPIFAGGHPDDSFLEKLPNKHTRVEIRFDEGKLFFNDQRKFGFMKPVPTEEVLKDKFIASLAPEPWQMTGKELYERLQRHKGAPIKAVILDQKIICGLGNIYADEALFFAKIHPERKAGTISPKEAEVLIQGAREVMERSLEAGGSTMATYVKADGTRGNYLDLFAKVFGREGEKCERCKAEIIKIRVAGRGTHICPQCQSWDFLSERKSQRKKPSKVSKSRTCRDFETENI